MTTTLRNAEILLSKEIGDYWAGTATSNGAAGGTSIVDTALSAKNNSWIESTTREMYDEVTSGTYDGEERRISSLDNTTGTLTVLAHTGQIASAVTYRVHRMFKASDKVIALVEAAKEAYPFIYERILDESLVSGNWLKDGSFEIWTSSSALTYWTKSLLTEAQTSSSPYYQHGTYSAKLDTAAGYIEQSLDQWDDLKQLAGQTVTFTLRAWCDTADCLRISINDGTDTTYSDYHDGDSAWTKNVLPLTVTATIQDNPTDISFKIHHENAAGTSYIDDARVTGPIQPRIYVGGLGLTENTPSAVYIEPSQYSLDKDWPLIRGIEYDKENGYMYLPYWVPSNRQLRIGGMGYLDFLASGVASTAWTATININYPQTKILAAQAAIALMRIKSMPSVDTGENQQSLTSIGYWEGELESRVSKFGMMAPKLYMNYAV